MVSKEVAADTEIAGAVAVVGEAAIRADAVPSATIVRTTVATAARMIRVPKENMARVPMNLQSLFPDLPEPLLLMDLRPSLPMRKGLLKSQARDLVFCAKRSVRTPPLKTISSSLPR